MARRVVSAGLVTVEARKIAGELLRSPLLEVGGGGRRLRPDALKLDIAQGADVDIVGSAEVYRVLLPGGVAYAAASRPGMRV